MLGLIIAFAILSLVAGVLGFTTVAVGFAAIAKVFFYLFLIGLAISIVMYFVRGKDNRPLNRP
ncbi:MAG: DUF1328 domain-containing protein [Candidatus Babeliales bacterium]